MPGVYENPLPPDDRQDHMQAAALEVYNRYSGLSTLVQMGGTYTDDGRMLRKITEIRVDDRAEIRDDDGNIIQTAATVDRAEFDAFVADLQARYPLAFDL